MACGCFFATYSAVSFALVRISLSPTGMSNLRSLSSTVSTASVESLVSTKNLFLLALIFSMTRVPPSFTGLSLPAVRTPSRSNKKSFFFERSIITSWDDCSRCDYIVSGHRAAPSPPSGSERPSDDDEAWKDGKNDRPAAGRPSQAPATGTSRERGTEGAREREPPGCAGERACDAPRPPGLHSDKKNANTIDALRSRHVLAWRERRRLLD